MAHVQANTDAACEPLVIYTAKRIYTMDESLPVATAVAVAGGRIVAVGDLASMDAWRASPRFSTVSVDTRFANHVLLPGLIDNHIHPFLGAILMPAEHIAPEPWRQADGSIRPAARSPDDYSRLLLERMAAHDARDPEQLDYFISFGYQPSLHGTYDRAALDALFPKRPVILIHRSFHETYLNTAALNKLGLTEAIASTNPQANWTHGHFYETGNTLVLQRLMPHMLRPEWYYKGLSQLTQLMHMGGITTAADMLFGAISPDYELAALDSAFQQKQAPMRVVNVFDARGFSNRASHKAGKEETMMGTPDTPIDFAAGLAAMQPLLDKASTQVGTRVWMSKAVKLFADGAMFSQLMQMNAPGYIDGHKGEWLMSPDVLASGVQTFWNAGWQMHVHVNGDGGMDSVLSALQAMQDKAPRFDHRFFMHHVGFSTAAQTRQMAALGAHASVNPYYIHALADDYAKLGLGEERASQITRAGDMLRNGLRVSFHSDFMMAPTEPLFLAWCAATRTTASGAVAAPTERLSLVQALRGITIDAAWALKLDHEIGSIVAGKRADFCVLADDPFELGAEGLKDVRVAGTVFEGTVYMLDKPIASLHTKAHMERPSGVRLGGLLGALTNRYKPVATRCCGAYGDTCDLGRQWASFVPR